MFAKMTYHRRFVGRHIGGARPYLVLSLLAVALLVVSALYWSPNTAQAQSTDNTLSTLIVSPKDIIGFRAGRTSYEVGVVRTVTQATITETVSDSGAVAVYSGTDADLITAEYQLNLSPGRNMVTITVTAEDSTTREYTVSINRGVTRDYGWQAGADLDGLIAARNDDPAGIWSNGTIMWVADFRTDKLYAYSVSDGTQIASRDITLAADNDAPYGIWSNDTTMWVADQGDDKLYAYRLSDGERDDTGDFTLAANNSLPGSIWSNDTTMWVMDRFDYKLYAYTLDNGERDDDKDITLAVGNTHPYGIWSNDTTMWVADFEDDKLYAYWLSDGERDNTKDFNNTLSKAGNGDPGGIWSNGTTMWVADWNDDKLYAYNMPLSPPRIEVSGRFKGSVDSQDQFCWDESQGVCGNWVTVYPRYDLNHAQVIFVAAEDWAPMGLWSDGATMWVGDHLHSSVHALDMGQLRRGVVRLDRVRSFEDELLNAAGTRHAGVVWGDADTLWVFDTLNSHFHAYDRDTKERIPDKSFSTRLDSGQSVVAWGVWSDGATMWISGPAAPSRPTLSGVFTVDLESSHIQKARGYEDVRGSRGLWSDGVTMWVASEGDRKLKAYDLDGGGRDADLDIAIRQVLNPAGVWSDGHVIWVADLDRRISSYCLTDTCDQVVPEPPGEDFAGDRTTAGRLKVGRSVTGRIAPSDDVDWVAIYLDAGVYQLDLSGEPMSGGGDGDPLPDPILLLLDFNGNEIRDTNVILMTKGDIGSQSTSGIGDDNGGVGKDAMLQVKVREPHYYYAVVGSAGPDMGTGGYNLSVVDELDVDDCTAGRATTCLVAGGTASGDIERNGDTDWFSASLTGGRTYRIDVKGASSADGGGNLANAGLTLYDASGIAISGASNNQGGPDNNARYIFRPTADETIYIEARDDDGVGAGTYTVAVTDVTDQNISEPLGQDFSGNASSPGQLLFGGMLTGGIDPDGDQDAFRVTLTAGEAYKFVLQGLSTGDDPLPDPYLVLNSESSEVASNDNISPTDVNARIDYTVPAGKGGEYTIVASSLITGGVGAYRLTLLDGDDDCVGDINTTCAVGSGPDLVATGAIEVDGDTDWFRLNVVSGRIYRIDVKGNSATDNGGTLINPGLTLYNAFGNAISGASTNMGGVENNARYIFRPTADQTIYIEARDDDGVGRGTYTVAVKESLDDCTADTATTCSVAVGGTISGEIEEHGDTDWFSASLTGDRIYRIDVKGDSSTDYGGTLANAGLTLYDVSGNAISRASNNQGGDDDNARYIFRPTADETIYIEARDDNGVGLGTYTVAVTDVTTDHNVSEPVGQDFPHIHGSAIGRVLVGGSVTGTLGSDDNDRFQVDLADGAIYKFILKGSATGDGTLEKPGLNLYKPSGGPYIESDVAVNIRNARITYFVPRNENGAYQLGSRSTGTGSSGIGTYTLTVEEAPDDCTSSTATTCLAAVGGTISGEIQADGDTDWFRLNVVSGRIYRIDVKGDSSTDNGGTLANAGLTLYDAIGNAISGASTNMGGADDNARYIFRPTADQTIYIEARDDNGIGDGTYTVAVKETLDDCTSDTATTCSVAVGGTISGEIEEHGDTDWFRLNVVSGRIYRIDVKGDSTTDDGGTLANAGLTLYDVSGNAISRARNKRGGADNNARYIRRSTADETIYIEARDDDGVGLGTYTVAVTDVTDQNISEPSGQDFSEDNNITPGRILIGGAVTGEIKPISDQDGFRVDLTDGVQYQFDLKGSATSDGTLPDPNLDLFLQVTDVTKRLVASNDDHSGSSNSQITYTVPTDGGGNYTIIPSDFSGSTGTYRLSLMQISVRGSTDDKEDSSGEQEEVEPPAKPQGLTGTVAHDLVSLIWDDPDDASITGYQILRRNRAVDAQGQFHVHVDDTGNAATSYVDRDVEPETRYGYRIKARNAGGLGERSVYFNADTPAAPDPALNNPATGAPTIIGTAQVGETLTADTSGIEDADGLDNATFSYQWVADGSDIAGGTGSSYTLAEAEDGKIIKVRVSFTDDAGNDESLTSAATAAVEPRPNSPATGTPVIVGTARAGETLTADASGIEDADGLDNATFGYQWLADGTAIPGATNSTYTPVDADEGKTVRVWVSFTDDAGNAEARTINSVPQVGNTLTVDTSGIGDADGLDDAVFAHQWMADDGNGDKAIAGATGPAYTLTSGDEGKVIRVTVTFTDDAGNEEALISVATAAVAAKPNSPATGAPTIGGTAQVGETLTADTSGITDNDGLTNVSYSYQWVANDGTSDTDIAGATGSTYTLVSADEGKTIAVRVSFTDDAGNEEALTSAATAAVGAEPESQEPPAKPTGLTGTVAHDAVSLTWNDPEDASIIGYQILRRNRDTDAPGNFEVHVDDTGSAAVSHVDRDVAPDTRYVYRIKARNPAGLSARSDQFNANTPTAPNSPATGAPTIDGTLQVGETLTADTSDIADEDGMDDVVFRYQWIVTDGGAELDIEGATEASYTLLPIDAALMVKVRVSFTDDRGSEETLTSAVTAVVADAE